MYLLQGALIETNIRTRINFIKFVKYNRNTYEVVFIGDIIYFHLHILNKCNV